MESKKTQKSAARRPSSEQGPTAAPKKRFSIQKLEERIAPKKGGGGAQTSSGLSWGTPSIY